MDLEVNGSKIELGELSMGVEKVGGISHETDPTVPEWAKQPNKPEYDYSEVKNTPNLNDFATKEELKAVDDKANETKETANKAKETAEGIAGIANNALTASNWAQEEANEAKELVEENNTYIKDHVIPVVQSIEGKANEADLSKVAKSGSYEDLSDTPDLSIYAEKTEVKKEISDLINSAPETLDTLGEIAKAIEDNEEVVDVLNQAIGEKAEKTALAEVKQLANETKQSAQTNAENIQAINDSLPEYEKTVDVDEKLESKVTKISRKGQLYNGTYLELTNGVTAIINVTQVPYGSSIARYTTRATVQTNEPTQELDAANKKYVDEQIESVSSGGNVVVINANAYDTDNGVYYPLLTIEQGVTIVQAMNEGKVVTIECGGIPMTWVVAHYEGNLRNITLLGSQGSAMGYSYPSTKIIISIPPGQMGLEPQVVRTILIPNPDEMSVGGGKKYYRNGVMIEMYDSNGSVFIAWVVNWITSQENLDISAFIDTGILNNQLVKVGTNWGTIHGITGTEVQITYFDNTLNSPAGYAVYIPNNLQVTTSYEV